MGPLGVIGGHNFVDHSPSGAPTTVTVEGRDGATEVSAFVADGHVFVLRHGVDSYTPAFLVDHVANLRALQAFGCTRVLGISSVGGLHDELRVGTFVVPDDFIALDSAAHAHDDARGHVVPAFDPRWRGDVVHAWQRHAPVPVRAGGVYWQTRGPRFETPAEVRLIAAHADVVGMTAASECVVACELGLAYASVCVVDNLANGLADAPLTPDEFEAGKRSTSGALFASLDAVLPVLAGP